MDAELCEQINNEMTGDEGEQWYIERYAQAHADKYDGEEFAPFFGYEDRKSTRLNSSHVAISYAVFCLKKKI